jgi:Na+/H+ antiporter NhaC
MTTYTNYYDVPEIRRSGTHNIFMCVHLITLCILPLLLITCITLMTGDIYYKEKDAHGNLKAWSRANKFVAFFMLLPPVLLIGAVLVALIGGRLAGH